MYLRPHGCFEVTLDYNGLTQTELNTNFSCVYQHVETGARSSKLYDTVYPQHWYTCRKLNCWFYSAVIFRGTGLNFGNDPFATVGEDEGIRMRRRRRENVRMEKEEEERVEG